MGTHSFLNTLCSIAVLLSFSFVSAQRHGGVPTNNGRGYSNGKMYRARYKVYFKLKRLNTKGEIITKKEVLYLKAESGEIDSLIMQIASSKKGLVSDIRFGEEEESNRLFVNPYAVFDAEEDVYVDEDAIYYYELHNRQSINVPFTNFSIKVISVPLKVRFGENEHEFSSDVNLGAFAGYSWGQSKFTHREKIGNVETETKKTLGILLGTEHLEFEFLNEDNELVEEETAVLSIGSGFIYSYHKFTAGLTGGVDFALGEYAAQWDYHARPWVGLAVGFSLFSF